jgi:hypothetical protein
MKRASKDTNWHLGTWGQKDDNHPGGYRFITKFYPDGQYAEYWVSRIENVPGKLYLGTWTRKGNKVTVKATATDIHSFEGRYIYEKRYSKMIAQPYEWPMERIRDE